MTERGLDHIGTKRLSVRRGTATVTISTLANDRQLELSADEWADLAGIILASRAAVDFWTEYE